MSIYQERIMHSTQRRGCFPGYIERKFNEFNYRLLRLKGFSLERIVSKTNLKIGISPLLQESLIQQETTQRYRGDCATLPVDLQIPPSNDGTDIVEDMESFINCELTQGQKKMVRLVRPSLQMFLEIITQANALCGPEAIRHIIGEQNIIMTSDQVTINDEPQAVIVSMGVNSIGVSTLPLNEVKSSMDFFVILPTR